MMQSPPPSIPDPAAQQREAEDRIREYNLATFKSALSKATEGKLRRELYESDVLDMTFYLQELDAGRSDYWQKQLMAEDKNPNSPSATHLLLALSLTDPSGNWLFQPHDTAGHKVLLSLPTSERDRIADVALRLSKLGR